MKPIPSTQLRDRLYPCMRLSKQYIQDPVAESIAGAPGGSRYLVDLFLKSVREFSEYNPPAGEPFVPEKRASLEERWRRNKGKKFAHKLVVLIKNGAICGDFPYALVDDDVSTLRTPNRGAPHSGVGGIDVLLSSIPQHRPVIGEIKAVTDPVTPFGGLVQALTYASELVTPAQSNRLRAAYPTAFAKTNAAIVEICLIVETDKGMSKKKVEGIQKQLGYADTIAKGLMIDSRRNLQKHIGSIMCLLARIENEKAVFSTKFKYCST